MADILERELRILARNLRLLTTSCTLIADELKRLRTSATDIGANQSVDQVQLETAIRAAASEAERVFSLFASRLPEEKQ